MNWKNTLHKANQLERSNKQGSDKPYGSYVDSVSGITEKAIINNWATKGRELSIPHPFVSSGSWIRALPETGAQYLTTTRADSPEPQLFATVSKNNEERVESYTNRLGIYRSLNQGEIEVSSSGIAQNYFGSRSYNSSRAGILLRTMNQDNLTISDRSPIHKKTFLNYSSSDIKDEYRVGIVSRPKNHWQTIFPKMNNNYMAEEYIHMLNPAKSGPTTLFLSQRGHVVDIKGSPIKHKRTNLPLRMLQNYYAINDTYTSFEIDQTGNYSIHLADSATEGMYCDIPNGGLKTKVKKDVGWEIDGSETYIVKGSYSKEISGSSTVNITKSHKLNAESIIETVVKSYSISSDSMSITTKSTLNIKANSSASITSTSTIKVSGTGGTDIGSSSSDTKIEGVMVNIAGGGLGVARVGDMVVGVGNLGLPIVGAIASGSPKVTSG